MMQDEKLHEMLSTCACLSVRKAARLITQRYDEALRPVGLRSTQLPIVVAASLWGPASLSLIAERLVIDQTTLSRNLLPLQRAGWIVVVQDQDDGRRRRIATTKQGELLLRQAIPLWESAQRRLENVLGGSDHLSEEVTRILRVAGSVSKR